MLDLGLGLKYPSPVGAGTPWTPADIANLSVFALLTPGFVYTDVARTTLATAGQTGKGIEPLFGTSISLSEATNTPTLRSDGLEFDASGVQQLLPSAKIVLSGTGSTVYTVQKAASGQICPFLNSIAGNWFVSGDGSGVIFQSGGPSGGMAMVQDALSVFRMDIDGSGDAVIDATGGVQNQLPGAGMFTFDLIAGTGINLANDSTANRYVLIVTVARRIVFGSAEDLLIRGWITTNTGASL